MRTLLRRVMYEPDADQAVCAAIERDLASGRWTEAELALLQERLAPVVNFSWVIPDRLAGCGLPDVPAAAAALAEMGVRALVSLTPEPPPAAWLAAHGVTGFHVEGVPDRGAPTVAQLATAVDFIERSLAAGQPVAVHCMAGQGRTGAVLAAYLVKQGEPAEQAITRLRAMRANSVESTAQEQAVHAYADWLAGGAAPAGQSMSG